MPFSSASITPLVNIKTTNTIVNGVDSPINVNLPFNGNPYSFTAGTGALQANVVWSDTRTYAVSTPVTFDLTTLAAAATNTGAAAFASIKLVHIINNGAFPILVGNAASLQFAGFWGGGTAVVTVKAGDSLLYVDSSAAGTSCATNKNLKVDPGSNAVNVTITLMGH